MDARISRQQKRISRRQEQRMARDIGGRTQPASGALPNAKGDVRAMDFMRGEAKFTAKDHYILKKSDLDKIKEEAGLEKSVLQLAFIGRDNKPTHLFAIYPIEGTSPISSGDTRLQSWAKTVRVGRDFVALWLVKYEFMFLSFYDGVGNEHRYKISYWQDYMDSLELR